MSNSSQDQREAPNVSFGSVSVSPLIVTEMVWVLDPPGVKWTVPLVAT